jgi:hypothetical protein
LEALPTFLGLKPKHRRISIRKARWAAQKIGEAVNNRFVLSARPVPQDNGLGTEVFLPAIDGLLAPHPKRKNEKLFCLMNWTITGS